MHLVDVPKSVPKDVSSTPALFSRFNVEKIYQPKKIIFYMHAAGATSQSIG